MSEVTKEMVQERLGLLQRQRTEAQAQVYGFDGAIQDATYWLKLLESEVDEGDNKPPDKPPDPAKVVSPKVVPLKGKGRK